MIGEELVAGVVEITGERSHDTDAVQLRTDSRYSGGGLIAIDGDANDFRAGGGERTDLADSRGDVGRICIGHRLHDDWRAAADHDGTDTHPDRLPPWGGASRCQRTQSVRGKVCCRRIRPAQRGQALPHLCHRHY